MSLIDATVYTVVALRSDAATGHRVLSREDDLSMALMAFLRADLDPMEEAVALVANKSAGSESVAFVWTEDEAAAEGRET